MDKQSIVERIRDKQKKHDDLDPDCPCSSCKTEGSAEDVDPLEEFLHEDETQLAAPVDSSDSSLDTAKERVKAILASRRGK